MAINFKKKVRLYRNKLTSTLRTAKNYITKIISNENEGKPRRQWKTMN